MDARVLVMSRLRTTVLLLFLAAVPPAHAQVATGTLTANINGLARLSFSTNSIAFPDGDPDVFPQLEAPAIAVTARARAGLDTVVSLTVQATDDLRSGVNTIGADAVTWVATGPGFIAGTLSRTDPQLVASWTGSGVRTGTQLYRFRNRWTYAYGTYTTSLLYTLTSP